MGLGTRWRDGSSAFFLAGLTSAAICLTLAAPAGAANGAFDRAWGEDVDAVNPGTAFEICILAASCKTGVVAGAGLGGELNNPRGVAADGAGNVYVADANHSRVQKFSAAGAFERAWGEDVVSAGPGDTGAGFEVCVAANGDTCKTGVVAGAALGGEMAFPGGLAADTAGSVYVADTDQHRVQKFNSAGAFERAWGEDVASAGPGDTGAGFEVCVAANGDTCKTGVVAGAALGGEMNSPFGVAADAAGSVYVADRLHQRVQRFADPLPGGGPGGPGGPAALPSNAFTIGRLKGRTLRLNLSSAGTVEIADAGARASGVGAVAAAKRLLKPSSAVGGPGTIAVKLRLTKAALRKLRANGMVRVRARITFAPNGGAANPQTTKLKVRG